MLVLTENFWKGKYIKEKGVELIFDSVGSTPATTEMLDGNYSIAFTHAPASAELCDKAKASGREIVHIPLMLCGVAPAYHISGLKGAKPLNFTADVLAGVFLGKIQKWDDPALKAINPGVELPAKKIVVIHRDDSSGTTQIFTEYLAAVSPEWQKEVGPGGSKIKWPTGAGANRNQGMHIAINQTDGAIGYIDRMFITLQDNTLDYGAVQNHDKTAFVRAEPANTTAALEATLDKVPDNLTFDLTDKPGKDSYPIAGVIYGLCSSVQPAGQKQEVVDFLRWAVHDGQKSIAGASFAPLPDELIPRIDKRLDGIKTAP
jgi:phosphate transport system substrate-binding protein